MPDTHRPGRLCNPWIDEARPANRWYVQGVTVRRITEAVALRRTEDGLVRIITRSGSGSQAWIKQAPLPLPVDWTVFGTNVRWTEGECDRITEAGVLRIIEDGVAVSLAELRHCEDGTERNMENGDIRTLEGFS